MTFFTGTNRFDLVLICLGGATTAALKLDAAVGEIKKEATDHVASLPTRQGNIEPERHAARSSCLWYEFELFGLQYARLFFAFSLPFFNSSSIICLSTMPPRSSILQVGGDGIRPSKIHTWQPYDREDIHWRDGFHLRVLALFCYVKGEGSEQN